MITAALHQAYPPGICSDAENKSSFGDFFLLLQMLNLIRKEKVIFEGVGGKKRRREVGEATTAAAARKRADWVEQYSTTPKGVTKTQKHFRTTTAPGKVCPSFVRCCWRGWICHRTSSFFPLKIKFLLCSGVDPHIHSNLGKLLLIVSDWKLVACYQNKLLKISVQLIL